MALRIIGIEKNASNVKINRGFEAMGDKLLLVTLDILPLSRTPYHWFLENNIKPPFDIAINPKTSVLNYIKFFFQDEKLSRKKNTLTFANRQDGLPVFDVSDYSDKEYHKFEEGAVEAYMDDDCLFLIYGDSYNCDRLYMDEKNSLLVDRNGIYAGLVLESLSEEEINELVVAKIL